MICYFNNPIINFVLGKPWWKSKISKRLPTSQFKELIHFFHLHHLFHQSSKNIGDMSQLQESRQPAEDSRDAGNYLLPSTGPPDLCSVDMVALTKRIILQWPMFKGEQALRLAELFSLRSWVPNRLGKTIKEIKIKTNRIQQLTFNCSNPWSFQIFYYP